jgi:hypothetical protein
VVVSKKRPSVFAELNYESTSRENLLADLEVPSISEVFLDALMSDSEYWIRQGGIISECSESGERGLRGIDLGDVKIPANLSKTSVDRNSLVQYRQNVHLVSFLIRELRKTRV